MFNLGVYGSHNSAVAIAKDQTVLEVVELERFMSKKHAGLWFYYSLEEPYPLIALEEVKKYFEEKYGVQEYENVVYNSMHLQPKCKINSYTIFPAKNYLYRPHHYAHACSAFYQTAYDKALIISADGGSDEGFFNIFLAERNKGFKKLYSGKRDLAVPYGMLAHFIEDITQEEIYWGNLVYAGKLMGFANYGTPRQEYIDKLLKIYNTTEDAGSIQNTINLLKTHLEIPDGFRFSGQDAKDLAASNQFVFEKVFEEETEPFFKEYPELPIVMVGGCALNILNNTKLAKTRAVFVPPNPSDCGIALGLLASIVAPTEPIDATYIGSPVWDKHSLMQITYERKAQSLDTKQLAHYITSGNIVGVVRGNAEHGPRALGNRSIICDPSIPNMKDTLNFKVKGREWYRPFAPVVRLEDVSKYFEWEGESRWMSFCPKVKDEYKEKLGAIVHVDGTARVQTVTREQNPFLYDLLTELDKSTGIGVLLNTSFNIAGKPILNTYAEALWVLDNKELDAVVLEQFIIFKNNRRDRL